MARSKSPPVPQLAVLGLIAIIILSTFMASYAYRVSILKLLYILICLPGILIIFSVVCAFHQNKYLGNKLPDGTLRDWKIPVRAPEYNPLKYADRLEEYKIGRRQHERGILYAYPFKGSPKIRRAIDSIISLVIKEFIRPWYDEISPNENGFPRTVEKYVKELVYRLNGRLVAPGAEREEIAQNQSDDSPGPFIQMVLTKTIPAIKRHVLTFIKSSQRLKGPQGQPFQAAVLQSTLAARYRSCTGQLHPAVDVLGSSTEASERDYLRVVMELIIPRLYPEAEYRSEAFRLLIREIGVGATLFPIVQTLADPDFCNRLIDTFATVKITEIAIIRKFREVLRRQTDLSGVIPPALPAFTEDMSAITEHHEEADKAQKRLSTGSQSGTKSRPRYRNLNEFLDTIKQCDDLNEAKNIRNQIVKEIRMKKILIADKSPEDVVNAVKVKDMTRYINRLIQAKKKVERQIAYLKGQPNYNKNGRARGKDQRTPHVSLQFLLQNAQCLHYFTEYMNKAGRSSVLRFWLVIEGFWQYGRNYETTGQSPTTKLKRKRTSTSISLSTVRGDIQRVFDRYVGESAPERIQFDPDVKQGFQILLARLATPSGWDHHIHGRPSDSASTDEEVLVVIDPHTKPFEILVQAQNVVFDEMKRHDLPGFRRSEDCFQLLHDNTLKLPSNGPVAKIDSLRRKRKSKSVDVLLAPHPGPLKRTTAFEGDSLNASLATHSATSDADEAVKHDEAKVAGEVMEPNDVVSPVRGRLRTRTTNRWRNASSDVEVTPLDDGDLLPSDAVQNARDELANLVNEAKMLAVGDVVKDDMTKRGGMPKISFRKWGTGGKGTLRRSESSRATALAPFPAAFPDKSASVSAFDTSPQKTGHSQLSSPADADDLSAEETKSLPDEVELSPESSSSKDPQSIPPSPVGTGPINSIQPVSRGLQTIREELDGLKQQLSIIDGLLSAEKEATKDQKERNTKDTGAIRYLHNFVTSVRPGKSAPVPQVGKIVILKRALSEIQREMRNLEMQRQLQLRLGYSTVIDPKTTTLTVSGCEFDYDGLREYVLYVISITNDTVDDAGIYPHATPNNWTVSRRYNDFLTLHQRLKKRYPKIMPSLDFPRKRPPATALIGLRRQEFLEERRALLEAYLKGLIKHHEVCRDVDLARFLYEATYDSSDRAFFVNSEDGENEHDDDRKRTWVDMIAHNIRKMGPNSKRDASEEEEDGHRRTETKKVNKLTSKLPFYSSSAEPGRSQQDGRESRSRRHSEASTSSTSERAPSAKVDLTSPSSPPVYSANMAMGAPESSQNIADHVTDIFIAMFDLRENNNWIRRHAVTLILQQILGGTLSRKVTEMLQTYLTDEESILDYVTQARAMLFPNDEFAKNWPERSDKEKAETVSSAEFKLNSLMSETLGSIVGKNNARSGAAHVMNLLQNPLLNKHIIYTIMDQILEFVFPDVPWESIRHRSASTGTPP